MNWNKISVAALMALSLTATSCNDYLDKLPDNRTEIDTEEKVRKLLVSAYSENECILIGETMSDNADDYGSNNPNTDRFYDQLFHWQDVTEVDNESPERFWRGEYRAIAAANQTLQSISDLAENGGMTDNLRHAKAEALLCRAYAHFMLVNIFCKNYNTTTSTTDQGLPYETKPSTVIYPSYDRGTVAQDYEKIEKDILEALPDIFDTYQDVPKYHWGKRSAYAFAARFYLFYEKWDKAEQYASLCLGSNPKALLRDWKAVSQMALDYEAYTNDYIDAAHNCNLLMQTAYSSIGLVCGPYSYYSRYAHGNYLANNETGLSTQNMWGHDEFYSPMQTIQSTNMDKTMFFKLPYLAEIVDPNAHTGYFRTVYPAFTADEVLLIRAEARILQKKYDEAAKDMDLWMKNIVNTSVTLTPQNILDHYSALPYAYEGAYADSTDSQIKKRLHPAFHIDEDGSMQEEMLQCLLSFRRIETIETGLRWFDIRRYGIVIPRRLMGADGKPTRCYDWLKVNDPRRTLQIPENVQMGGFPATDR